VEVQEQECLWSVSSTIG